MQDFNWNPFRLIAVPACEGLPAPVALPQVSAAAAAAAGFSMRYNGSGLAPFTGLDTALDPRSNRARSSTVCQVIAAGRPTDDDIRRRGSAESCSRMPPCSQCPHPPVHEVFSEMSMVTPPQVEGCSGSLKNLKEYHQRYKICEHHLKVSSIVVEGVRKRFCQQCGHFHDLSEFDGDKRSCRARLQVCCLTDNTLTVAGVGRAWAQWQAWEPVVCLAPDVLHANLAP
jgi:SBP domain